MRRASGYLPKSASDDGLNDDEGIIISEINDFDASEPVAPPLMAQHLDPLQAQHRTLGIGFVATAKGRQQVLVNYAESRLAWLYRRKGRDGRPLLEPIQFAAGERLRHHFTRAQTSPV